jgi:hypothetical protein
MSNITIQFPTKPIFVGYVKRIYVENKQPITFLHHAEPAAVCVDKAKTTLYLIPIATAEKHAGGFRFRFDFPKTFDVKIIGRLEAIAYSTNLFSSENEFAEYQHVFKKTLEFGRAKMRFYYNDPNRKGPVTWKDDFLYIAAVSVGSITNRKKIFSNEQGFIV